MAKSIAILLIMVAVALAMAAPGKRETGDIICDATTACVWEFYKPVSKKFEYFVSNNDCKCAPNLVCSYHEDNESMTAFVHRCKIPSA